MTTPIAVAKPLPAVTTVSARDIARAQAAVRRHMPALDGLRGLAILFVIWNHVGLSGGRADGMLSKLFIAGANAGWVGVQLFFVLSGFLITGILVDARGQANAWRNFSMRRVLRIFPLYYVTLAILLVLLPAIGVLPAWLKADYEHQVWYWTYLSNWSIPLEHGGPGVAHFWSLAVEEQFYLMWPLVALRVRPRTLAIVCALLVVSALATRINIMYFRPSSFYWTEAAYSWTMAQWDSLAIGALVALAFRDARWAAWIMRHNRAIGALATLGMATIIVYARGFGIMSPEVMTAGKTLFAILTGAVVAEVVARPSTSLGAGILGHPALAYVGKYSYAIYVFHLPLAHLFRSWFPVTHGAQGTTTTLTLLAHMIGVLAVSLALARTSWVLIEQPALRLKSRFPMPA
jgi:peptidoglycan/LPS O-acetylase OafA/YrhL